MIAIMKKPTALPGERCVTQDDVERELRTFVEERLLEGRPAELGREEPLIASGRIDSMGLMQLLGHIQQRWQVDLLALGGPDDFVSLRTLADAVCRHLS